MVSPATRSGTHRAALIVSRTHTESFSNNNNKLSKYYYEH